MSVNADAPFPGVIGSAPVVNSNAITVVVERHPDMADSDSRAAESEVADRGLPGVRAIVDCQFRSVLVRSLVVNESTVGRPEDGRTGRWTEDGALRMGPTDGSGCPPIGGLGRLAISLLRSGIGCVHTGDNDVDSWVKH